jgi:hypothetical protein
MKSLLVTCGSALAFCAIFDAGTVAVAQLSFPAARCTTVGASAKGIILNTGQAPVRTADLYWKKVEESDPNRLTTLIPVPAPQYAYITPPQIVGQTQSGLIMAWHLSCNAKWIQPVNRYTSTNGPCTGCPASCGPARVGPGTGATIQVRAMSKYTIDFKLPPNVATVFPDVTIAGNVAANDNVILELNGVTLTKCMAVPTSPPRVDDLADVTITNAKTCYTTDNFAANSFKASLTPSPGHAATLVPGMNSLTATVYNHRHSTGLLVEATVTATCSCAAVHGVGSSRCPP